ncbi:hypothetical protein ANO14919_065160 [Xylariales sp. No.14919]|nr:hypothetical protein ANO14919_065160 [Xylariales sp. No.14919]
MVDFNRVMTVNESFTVNSHRNHWFAAPTSNIGSGFLNF